MAAAAGSVMGAWGADAGPGVGVVGTVEAWRMAEREKAALRRVYPANLTAPASDLMRRTSGMTSFARSRMVSRSLP